MKDFNLINKNPNNWKIKRIKEIANIEKGKSNEMFDFEKNVVGLLPCIDTNFLRNKMSNIMYNKSGRITNVGDVLILWDGANAGEVFINKTKGYLGSTFGKFNNKKSINNKFLFYYFKGIEKYFRNNLVGMGIPHVNTNELKTTIFFQPPYEDQLKIVNFLDKKCSKIESEVELLLKKSKLLEEYKQSLIFETVTKGLDKNAKMKDSGVDWIGEIPEHWNVKKLKSIVKTLSKSNIPSGDSEDGPFKFYVSGRKIKSIDKYNLSQKAILLPTGGTFMVHFNDDEKSAYSTDVLPIVSSKKNLEIKYLYYYLYSLEKYFHEKLFYGTGLKHLNRKGLLSEIIYLPHISEQKKITDFLNIETLKIENNINLINRKIELLKEYKQSLIYEAVTGQLEIE